MDFQWRERRSPRKSDSMHPPAPANPSSAHPRSTDAAKPDAPKAGARFGDRRGIWRAPVLGPAFFALWRADARRKLNWMAPFVRPNDQLLEIGSGPGSLLAVMRATGHDVTAIDIKDTAYTGNLRPIIYDGADIPFGDDAFDSAILATVLHHTAAPNDILREAMRVAPRVIVIEDIYTTRRHRQLTKIADSMTNLEFFGHPHSNRDDDGWRNTFDALGMRLVHASQKPYARYFRQALYVVERA